MVTTISVGVIAPEGTFMNNLFRQARLLSFLTAAIVLPLLVAGCGGSSGQQLSGGNDSVGIGTNGPGTGGVTSHKVPRLPKLWVVQLPGIPVDGQPPHYALYQGAPGSAPGTPLTAAQYQTAVANEATTSASKSAVIGLVFGVNPSSLGSNRSLEIIPGSTLACYVGQEDVYADAEFTVGRTNQNAAIPWTSTELYPKTDTEIGINAGIPVTNICANTGVDNGTLIGAAIYYYFPNPL